MPDHVVVLGAGPAGLASAYELTKAQVATSVYERSPWVGGLARTIEHNGFRFDIGGHRWFTKKPEINQLFSDVLGDEMLWVDRVSRIYFDGKFFFYPLKITNALTGMGLSRSIKAVADYGAVHLKPLKGEGEPTMELAYVNQFGRTLYEQFFKNYSEKVWGRLCNDLSGDWVTQRTKGLSLLTAIRDAFSRSPSDVESLVDRFMYPRLGIGRFSELMAESVSTNGGQVIANHRVRRVLHENGRVTAIVVRPEVEGERVGSDETITGDQFISSIPVTQLIESMRPAAPADVLKAARELQFRELVTINLMLDREQVTNDTWLYVHDREISFARLHEPKNWSADMVPAGKTSLVCEVFCDRDDKVWTAPDGAIIDRAVNELSGRLGFIRRSEVLDAFVLRAVRAYPVYTLGYQEKLDTLKRYLRTFENLQIVGRYGTFRYNNTDHSVETGVLAAKNLLGEKHDIDLVNSDNEYLEERRIPVGPRPDR